MKFRSKCVFQGKKILIASQCAGFVGGVERHIYQTAEMLRRNGAEIWGCFLDHSRAEADFNKAFDHLCEPGLLPLEEFDLACLNKVMALDFIQRFLTIYQDCATLWVHDHDYYCPRACKTFPFSDRNCRRGYHRLWCGLCGMVQSPHVWPGGLGRTLENRFTVFTDRLRLLQRFPKVVVLSSYMRDNLLLNGFRPEHLHVILPYVPTGPARPVASPPKFPVVLFAGSMWRGKGCDLFLKILARLKRPFQARIVGDGKERASLERQASRLGLGDRVTFTGWVLEPEKEYRNADLLISPGRWQEPLGLVPAEAAASGLPVVGFRLGGIEESVVDGENGFLVPEGDVEQAAQKVDNLLDNPKLRREMGMIGRQMAAQHFSEAHFLKGFARLLASSENGKNHTSGSLPPVSP
ncbi:MAG: glycosyltransferase family 4 protein [Victivallales bacterium]|nr:glycosyltransferase family 4 protein [Victivallales bacterium]